MSLIKCAKCGELFSDSYRRCPFCAEDEEYYRGNVKKGSRRGAAGEKKGKALIPVLLLVVFVLAVGAVWRFFGYDIKDFLKRDTAQTPVEDVDTQQKEGQETTPPVVLVMDSTMRLAPDQSESLLISGGTSYEWNSSDPTVVTVSSDGTVTALSEGTAIITATDVSGQSAVCSVTVAEKTDEPEVEDPSGNEGGGTTSTKPVKPGSNSTTPKVDISQLKFSIPAYGLSLSPTADGSYDLSIMKSLGESSVEIVIDGTTSNITWTSANEGKVTATGGKSSDGKQTVTFKAVGGGETTVTAKIGEESINFLIRVK